MGRYVQTEFIFFAIGKILTQLELYLGFEYKKVFPAFNVSMKGALKQGQN